MGCSSSTPARPSASSRRGKLRKKEESGGPKLLGGESKNAKVELPLEWKYAKLDLMKLLQDSGVAKGGRSLFIGSKLGESPSPFCEKDIQDVGDGFEKARFGLGFTCRKGLKPEAHSVHNQDSWVVLREYGNFSIYGVFDGHGEHGHHVSNFAKEAIPKLIAKDSRFKSPDMKSMMVDVFPATQDLIRALDKKNRLCAQDSGTTATVVIHDHQLAQLLVSHVADSTCVIGEYSEDGKGTLKGRRLTRDHKPHLPDEKARIEKKGGRVIFDGRHNHRVYDKRGLDPGLAMSRCLGDLYGHSEAGLTSEPEVTVVELTPLNNLLLLCSDGVWDFVTPDEAVNIAASEPPSNAMDAANKLAKLAWDRWMVAEAGKMADDITVVLAHLTPPDAFELEM